MQPLSLLAFVALLNMCNLKARPSYSASINSFLLFLSERAENMTFQKSLLTISLYTFNLLLLLIYGIEDKVIFTVGLCHAIFFLIFLYDL